MLRCSRQRVSDRHRLVPLHARLPIDHRGPFSKDGRPRAFGSELMSKTSLQCSG
jgi:hypothetical protein